MRIVYYGNDDGDDDGGDDGSGDDGDGAFFVHII